MGSIILRRMARESMFRLFLPRLLLRICVVLVTELIVLVLRLSLHLRMIFSHIRRSMSKALVGIGRRDERIYYMLRRIVCGLRLSPRVLCRDTHMTRTAMGIDLDPQLMMSMGTRLRIDRLVRWVSREWRVDGCVCGTNAGGTVG
jgi:hypothetical protein